MSRIPKPLAMRTPRGEHRRKRLDSPRARLRGTTGIPRVLDSIKTSGYLRICSYKPSLALIGSQANLGLYESAPKTSRHWPGTSALRPAQPPSIGAVFSLKSCWLVYDFGAFFEPPIFFHRCLQNCYFCIVTKVISKEPVARTSYYFKFRIQFGLVKL